MISNDEISSLSILIPGIISCVRFRKINKIYKYFIFCLFISSANELLSCILVETGHYTVINNNIYVLAEALLYVLFFKNIGNKEASKLYMALIIIIVITWLLENVVLNNIMHISSWFRIMYSFIIVLLSITFINRLVISDSGRHFENYRESIKNPIFLICIGSIIFFTFKILVEVFWLYGLNIGKVFRNKVYDILLYVNFLVNLIYALAVLWIPTKRQYITSL